MSRARRTAGERIAPAPCPKEKWYRRTGWLLAVSLVCCAAATVGLRLALGAGFGALFRAWGVDASIVARAPGWARLIYRWHGSAVTLLSALALLGLCRWLRTRWMGSGSPLAATGEKRAGAFARFALLGLGAAAALLLLGLLPDSLRAERAAPRLTPALPALLAVALVSALAEEVFTKGVLYDGLSRRWGAAWATTLSTAVFFLIAGGLAGNAVSAANVLLMGLMLCALHRRRGLWACAGLRFGWTAATVFLLGFGGGEASVWRFYGVSEGLLTGGDAGPAFGLYLTAALLGGIAWLLSRERRA